MQPKLKGLSVFRRRFSDNLYLIWLKVKSDAGLTLFLPW